MCNSQFLYFFFFCDFRETLANPFLINFTCLDENVYRTLPGVKWLNHHNEHNNNDTDDDNENMPNLWEHSPYYNNEDAIDLYMANCATCVFQTFILLMENACGTFGHVRKGKHNAFSTLGLNCQQNIK